MSTTQCNSAMTDMAKLVDEAEIYAATQTTDTYEYRRLVNTQLVRTMLAWCEEFYESEDVLAPVGNSSYGEAYQDGWIAGARAYRDSITELKNRLFPHSTESDNML